MEKICGIYKVENKINHKIYIGQSKDIYSRWRQHQRYVINDGSYFHKALIKYGINNFNWEIIESCSENELNEKEEQWINKYNSLVPNGYNIKLGGLQSKTYLAKQVNKYSLDGKLLATFISATEAANSIQCAPAQISIACNTSGYCHGFIWRYDIDKEAKTYKVKNILQFDLEGNYINSYYSAREAAFVNNLFETNIRSACKINSKIKSCGNYQWRYLSDLENYPVVPIINKRAKAVIQYDNNNNFIAEYSTITEASKKTGTQAMSIIKACKKQIKQAGGYHWEYK